MNHLHPIFTNILTQHFGTKTPSFNFHSTESSQSRTKAEAKTMNLNHTMSAVEAHDDALLAQQEARDVAWEAAYEAAEEDVNFNDLLDALFMLPEPEKAAALVDLTHCRFPGSFAEAYDRLLAAKAEAIMQRLGKEDGQALEDLGGDAA